jgi:hypothetical protein
LHSVLILSSSEGLDVARAVQTHLEGVVQATVWRDGPFGLSSTSLESLIESASQFDFAVLVATADGTLESRGTTSPVPSDNILFELGLYIGSLGRHRAFLVYCEDDHIKLPSDLAGTTAATYKRRADGNLTAAIGPAATKLREAIKKAPSRSPATLPMIDALSGRLARSHHEQRIMAKLEAVTGLRDLRVWPENRPEMDKIADLLVQFEDRAWGKRTLLFSLDSTLLVRSPYISCSEFLRPWIREKSPFA